MVVTSFIAAILRWEADERPEPRSLGLLPSGSDPVGEWLVHRQPPGPYIGRRSPESKQRARLAHFLSDVIVIEPGGLERRVVAAAEALAQRQADVAFEPRPGRGQMVFLGARAGAEHGCFSARRPHLLISDQRRAEIVAMPRDHRRQHAAILDRHGGALA